MPLFLETPERRKGHGHPIESKLWTTNPGDSLKNTAGIFVKNPGVPGLGEIAVTVGDVC